MTASPLIIPVARFFTVSGGAGLAGGKVYTYEAGTNTPKVTYTDYTASVMSQNTNPVILDSSGSADIWLVGNYKINLTDSNDVQQANYPVDNVSSFAAGNNFYVTTGTANNYILTPSPALLQYTAGDTFNVQFNVANTGPSTINVSGLGAKSLVLPPATALTGGELITSVTYTITYDGTNFQVTNTIPGIYPNLQTGTTYAFANSNRGNLVTFSNTSAIAATIGQAGSTFPDGWYVLVQNRNSGIVTITPTTSTIDGATSLRLRIGEGAIIVSDGTNYYTERFSINIAGDLQTIASATTTNLGTVDSHFVNITGTTTITSFGTAASIANPLYFITFASALTLTHNGTSLIIPGAANITTAANDFAIVQYLGGGNWIVNQYVHASGILPIAAGGTGANTAATAFSNLKQAATTAVTGVTQYATAAQTKTGTSTTLVPTVSVMASHQGMLKAWVNFSLTGSINDSYNVSSVGDTSSSTKTINFTTSLSNASYCASICQYGDTMTAYAPNMYITTRSVSSFVMNNTDEANNVQGWMVNVAGQI